MKWEYLRTTVTNDSEFEELGLAGWELVTIDNRLGYVRYVFKRPLVL